MDMLTGLEEYRGTGKVFEGCKRYRDNVAS